MRFLPAALNPRYAPRPPQRRDGLALSRSFGYPARLCVLLRTTPCERCYRAILDALWQAARPIALQGQSPFEITQNYEGRTLGLAQDDR